MKKEKYKPQYVHLRYGILMPDRKQRYTIALQSNMNYPLVIYTKLKSGIAVEWQNFTYSLYADALSEEAAEEILKCIKENRMPAARTHLRKSINRSNPYFGVEGGNRYVLEDLIPDDWYDSWKEMEAKVTTAFPEGFYETDVLIHDEYSVF